MAEYDRKVLETAANRLYSKAQSIILSTTIKAILLGVIIGYGLTLLPSVQYSAQTTCLAGAIVCGLAGVAIGKEKAFEIRVEEQRLRCLLKLESAILEIDQVSSPMNANQ